jgi:hypothetical protein
MQARQLARDIKPGDHLVLGHSGPNSRVQPGGWAASTLETVVLAEVTQAGGAVLGPDAMEGLRLSANVGGVPIPAGSVDLMALEARLEEDDPAGEPGVGGAPDLALDVDGNTDAFAQVIVRREQKSCVD